MQQTNVSIVICTKDRSDHLKECLESIYSSNSNFLYKELIVVDSTIDDAMREINRNLTAKFDGVYIREIRKGLSYARNAGIKNSAGDIIVFADDDFIVDKNWINNIVNNYSDITVMCCTGNMLSYRKDEISSIFEKVMSFDRGKNKRIFTNKDINILNIIKPVTHLGNIKLQNKNPVPWAIGRGFCSFRKEVFDNIGYFDEKLGIGTPTLGGEEIDMFYRILKRYKIVYEPTAIIYHNHRQTLEGIIKAAYNGGASNKALIKKYFFTDSYIFISFYAILCYLIFACMKSYIISEDKIVKNMITEQFKGMFHNPY